MPTALRVGPYRFYFYASDCDEPRHVHVDHGNLSAKLWLDPDVRVADNRGFSRRELREVERLATLHLKELRDAWDEFCGDGGSA
jgi:hypothetical protein